MRRSTGGGGGAIAFSASLPTPPSTLSPSTPFLKMGISSHPTVYYRDNSTPSKKHLHVVRNDNSIAPTPSCHKFSCHHVGLPSTSLSIQNNINNENAVKALQGNNVLDMITSVANDTINKDMQTIDSNATPPSTINNNNSITITIRNTHNEDTKKKFNEVNASYFNKHAAKKKNELGTDVYKIIISGSGIFLKIFCFSFCGMSLI